MMRFLVIFFVILMLTACATPPPRNKCEFQKKPPEREVEMDNATKGEIYLTNSGGPLAQADTISILKKNTEEVVKKYPDGKDRTIRLDQGQYTIIFKKQYHYPCSIDIELPKGHIITIENVKLKPKPTIPYSGGGLN